MNAVDAVLVAALLYSGFRGFRQGALSQVAAFGGAVVGLGAGAAFAPDLAGRAIARPGLGLAALTLGLLLAMVLVGQGIGFAIGVRLRAGAHRAGVGGVDRAAGIAVGVAGLVFTVWLMGSVLAQGPTRLLAQQVRESRVVGVIGGALPPPPDVFGRVGQYLDRQGFPQVFAGLGGRTAPPVAVPPEATVAAAAAAGQNSTVQVEALGCGGVSAGSGFVTRQGFVVTNAHVVAGGEVLSVRDGQGTHEAVAIHVDPAIDLAVLSSPQTAAAPIGWTGAPPDRDTPGATLGFPGGQRDLNVRPAAVRSRGEALGRDIYGRGVVARDVLTLSAAVQRGDSGGPFVTADGLVGGVVFAAAAAEPGVGYALTGEGVRAAVDGAIARNAAVGTGECRFSQ